MDAYSTSSSARRHFISFDSISPPLHSKRLLEDGASNSAQTRREGCRQSQTRVIRLSCHTQHIHHHTYVLQPHALSYLQLSLMAESAFNAMSTRPSFAASLQRATSASITPKSLTSLLSASIRIQTIQYILPRAYYDSTGYTHTYVHMHIPLSALMLRTHPQATSLCLGSTLLLPDVLHCITSSATCL